MRMFPGPHQHAIGRSRGGQSTKIRARVGAHGLPLPLALSAGQATDMRAVPPLLAGLQPASGVVADRDHDHPAVLDAIADAGSTAHIPAIRRKLVQRRVEPALYGQRDLTERCFNRLKHWRCLATRFDKLARNHLSTVAIAAIRLWTWFEAKT